MPLKAINYDKTHFYKIVCRDTSIKDCYVGHTTDFNSRKSKHKSRCSNPTDKKHNYNVYRFIRANGGWENWEMILIETHKCQDVLEARKIERDYKEQLEGSLNAYVPSRTQTEYRNEHRDKYRNYNKQYYEDNKDDILQYHKDYYEHNKERLIEEQKQTYHKNREKFSEQRKQYRKDNPEKVRELERQAYQRNKEQKRQKAKEKIECACGAIVCRAKMTDHKKTLKHQQYIQSLEQNNP